MLFSKDFHTNIDKMDAAVVDSKEVFGENVPYIKEYRFGGTIIIFSAHFIRTTREAMSSDYMAKMNETEVALFNKFVEYQNGSSYRDISTEDNDVVASLDAWFMDDINGVTHPVINESFDAPTHTWTTT